MFFYIVCTPNSNLGVNSRQLYKTHSGWYSGNPFKVTIEADYYMMTYGSTPIEIKPIIYGVTKEWTESSNNNGMYQKALKVHLKNGDVFASNGSTSQVYLLIAFII